MQRQARVGIAIVMAALVASAIAAFAPRLAALPGNAAAMTARSVCSGTFVAGRAWRDVQAHDLLPASAVLGWVTVQVDEAARTVTAAVPGFDRRTAVHVPGRGCVLRFTQAGAPEPAGAAPDPGDAGDAAAPWPRGDTPLPPADWGTRVDAAALARVLDTAFEGAGDPAGANARAVAIVHAGRLLANRGAPGFAPGTRLHGWSMTKTVIGMLAHQLAAEGTLALDAPVIAQFPPSAAPAWVERWRADARARITVADLLHMRDGLANREEYGPLGSVPQMLWGEPDAAAFAAQAAAELPAGTHWRYLSGSTNLLARTLRARFATDADYLAYPRRVLFDPIGARTALIETDASGTWVGSSYLWASAADWARIGQLLLADGRWGERPVLAPGVLARLSAPARPDGAGRGYGAQVWRAGDPRAGTCRGRGLPEDLLTMSGHWGQLVAVVPSRETVIVRLGWTFDRARFDPCAFVGEVLATLR
jgi:CubicO group peptidase (beta-lactamase class C family)